MTSLILVVAAAWISLAPAALSAHPLDPALADLRETPRGEVTVLWRVPGSQPTAAPLQLVLPARCVRRSAAVDVETGRRVTSTWAVDCGSEGIAGAHIAVAGLAERGTDALLRVHLADGRLIQAVLRGDRPSLVLPTRPSWVRLLRDYFELGVEHILHGFDHLALILGFVLLVPDRRQLLWTLTAFTAGHAVTLSLALLGAIHLAPGPVDTVIAATIVAVAIELSRSRGQNPSTRSSPYVMAFVFGLLHGLGFAGALARIGLPTPDIPAALVAFNVGIETGQIIFVAAVLAVRSACCAIAPTWSAAGRWLSAYTIGSLATFWMLQRIRVLLF